MSLFGAFRHAGPAPLSVEGHLPGFDGATGWLNSPPLTAANVRGKVILVDFWTYTCINWLHTLAYVRAWADGEPPGDAHGLDVDEQGHGALVQPRLYQLVRERGSVTDRTFEITFLGSGVEAYVFTFG